jgi:putative AdoMet-dependent methyltransferase
MNTKTVSEILDISLKTLRLYEQYGIIKVKRDSNNYRNYAEEDIKRLRQVKLLRELGIPLKNIKDIFEKSFEDNKVVRELTIQLKAVDNRISELESIRNTLVQSVNDALLTSEDNSNIYFENISKCLDENLENRRKWVDRWNFDSWSKSYDISVRRNINDDLKLFEGYDYVLESLVEKVKESNSTRILDIGCGTCNIYEKLDGNVEFTGIDQSIEMLLVAKRKYGDISLRLGSFLDKPFLENHYDIIISTYAFHHLNDLEKETAVNYMLKYLKPNGKMLIGDLMFESQEEILKKRDDFLSNGRVDLWEIIEDEYYTNIKKLKSYSELLGCSFNYTHLVNFTWLIEIIKP